MKQLKVKTAFIKEIKPDVFLIGLDSGYIAKTAKPGQFLHIKVDEKNTILRRPLSIHKIDKNLIYILFRVRGRGTKILSGKTKGNIIDVIGPLGNGFNTLTSSRALNILVAGGMGVAPLVFLGKKLTEIKNQKSKCKNLVLLGAKSKKEVLAEKEFKKLRFEINIATDDGSRGFKGNVAELLKKILSTYQHDNISTNIYACGPKEMFYEIKKVIAKYPSIQAQVSFEQFMGCGLGICYGCVIETKEGYKKVCKDGPVFDLKII
ncbi:MAG: dihydroorotate dehydrogenase electron transfer subunit [Candidatus Omnitrophica bacterium]|nr:dihydroorotate dehydrogenase electron transfer subunit [Candidatus Omnitrophota bacterium]